MARGSAAYAWAALGRPAYPSAAQLDQMRQTADVAPTVEMLRFGGGDSAYRLEAAGVVVAAEWTRAPPMSRTVHHATHLPCLHRHLQHQPDARVPVRSPGPHLRTRSLRRAATAARAPSAAAAGRHPGAAVRSAPSLGCRSWAAPLHQGLSGASPPVSRSA